MEPAIVANAAADATEVEVWAGRTHWKYFAGQLLGWAAMNLAAALLIGWWAWHADAIDLRGAAEMIAGLVLITGLCIVGGVIIRVLSTHFRLTSQRLFIRRGILSQTVDQIELIRVDDVRIETTLLNRVVGVGCVTLLTTDATEKSVVLMGVARPEEVGEQIRRHTRALRRSSLHVETL